MEGKRSRINGKEALVLEVLAGNMKVRDLLPIINSGVPHSQRQSILNRMATTKGWEQVALELLDENSDLETLNLVVRSLSPTPLGTPLGQIASSKMDKAIQRILENFKSHKWDFNVYQRLLIRYDGKLEASRWLRIYHQMAEEHPGCRVDARIYKKAFEKADVFTQLEIIEQAKHHGVNFSIGSSLLKLADRGDIENAFRLLRARGEVDSGIAEVIGLSPRLAPLFFAKALEDPANTNILLENTLRAVIQKGYNACEELLGDQRVLSSIFNMNCTDPIICKGVARALAKYKRPELARMLAQQAVEPEE